MVVILQGFEAFPRHNPIWSRVSDSWGFTIAPWAAIAAILTLGIAWTVKTRGFDVPPKGMVDLRTGRAPILGPAPQPPTELKRIQEWVLDHL